jgi:hypothetical protein
VNTNIPGDSISSQSNYLVGYYIGGPMLIILIGVILSFIFRTKTETGKQFNKLIFRISLVLAMLAVALIIIQGP